MDGLAIDRANLTSSHTYTAWKWFMYFDHYGRSKSSSSESVPSAQIAKKTVWRSAFFLLIQCHIVKIHSHRLLFRRLDTQWQRNTWKY